MRVLALTRRFSLFSAALVLLAGLVIGELIRQHEIGQLETLVEDRNVVMSKVLVNLLAQDLDDLVSKPIQPAEAPKIRSLLNKVSGILQASDIANIKLFNRDGLVVFSTTPEQFGQDKSQYLGFTKAITDRVYSQLSHRAQFKIADGSIRHEIDVVSSYIPIKQGNQVYAVFELYQDVTPLLQNSQLAHWRAISIILGILAFLLLLQTLAVNYTQRQIRQQEQALEEANHDLDRRITASTQSLRRSEAQISELLNEQQLIFNNARVGIVLLKNRRILKSNQRMAEMFGYASPDEYEGKSTAIFYRSEEEFLEIGKVAYAKLSEKGNTEFETRMRRKDGCVFWVSQSGQSLNKSNVLDNPSIWVYADITERKLAEEQIAQLAFYDQLTLLPNRLLFADRLRQATIASERHGGHGALLLLDLDHFKTLNDTLGHDQGDQLLKQVAEIITASVRQVDTVARLGGDEFVILLNDLDQDALSAAAAVEAIGQKLLTSLKQDFKLASTTFHCSASIGATLFCGERIAVEELLKQVDLAMYRSKATGRNALTFFDQTMEAHILNRAQIETDLRLAIQQHQFVLHYQPQVSGNSQQIIGAEALIRWQHPLRGMVPPNDFITSAEENGLILPIGQWVMDSACRQLARWASQPLFEHLSIAVNVSVEQFKQADFVEQVRQTLAASGANPQRLKLELTESLFAQNIADIICKISALKAIGVGFALDDFGTGYSSLAYLSQLPLDQLKIDRSFVKDIESSENNIVICAATIKLAHSLKMQVIAEGVETEAQRYFLTTVHHCDFLQGYLISKPVALADFEALVHQAAA